MKAITTKWLGCTNTKPFRVKAFDDDGNSVTISVDYSDGGADQWHFIALQEFLKKYKWNWDRVVMGEAKRGERVWVPIVTIGTDIWRLKNENI